MCLNWGSNWQLFGSQVSTQSTEPHQPGLKPFNPHKNCKPWELLQLLLFSWRNWGTERLEWWSCGLNSGGLAADSDSYFPQLISGISCIKRMCRKAFWLANWTALHCRICWQCCLLLFLQLWQLPKPWSSGGKLPSRLTSFCLVSLLIVGEDLSEWSETAYLFWWPVIPAGPGGLRIWLKL